MLVAKRDPYEFGAHDRPVPHAGAASASSRFTRTLNVLQLLGALVAVPVGIGSAYSMYQANFSPEATCKSLRVSIVRMLDKNVDAGTRHMLVRRDVEAFENTCGTVDPDATKAFKALLAAEKATAAPAATASVPRAEPQPPAVVRKAEPAPAVKPKQPAVRAAAVATEAPQDTTASDAAWLAAVRGALVSHERRSASAATPTAPAAPPRMLGELQTLPAQPAASLAAPTLPPPAEIAPVAAPQVDPDHPVPPAVIPEAASEPEAHPRTRFGKLVEDIPFVGKSLADRVSR